MFIRSLSVAAFSALIAVSTAAAQHQHGGTPGPIAPGQSAFATISDIVAILKADPVTDWSKVDLEALRQHLIDMDDVVLHSSATKREVPGGVETTVTGTGRTAQAIKRMLSMHAMALSETAEYEASAAPVTNGMRLTVTAKNKSDTSLVARIRGLGFAGLLTEANHHAQHHLALARGEVHPHGK